ncbi:hypothetical protein [Caldifermentibacillus hisashii]|uniref:hypothetical protein n=2 Tax=Bacillaceae TaxID=186817 RepID=UPI003D1EDD9E
MKKVIDGSVYNTETAQKIFEKFTVENEPIAYGSEVKKLQQLYKTKSNRYFVYVKREFETWVDVNDDDLNPKYKLEEVIDEKIIPLSLARAKQFAREVYSDDQTDEETKKQIEKYFPVLSKDRLDREVKYQKKIYLSERANWYLELMLDESKDTNSSLIEKLIIKEFKRLHSEGVFVDDPFPDEEDFPEKEQVTK